MKIFEIIDEELNKTLGCLLYYEKEKSFIIELVDNLDEWDAPLLLTSFVKENIYTIPRDVSLLWVQERIIPSDRQNISSILSNHRLKEYDEMKLLELADGKCSQDSIYIKKIDSLPGYVKKRGLKNLTDLVVLDDNKLLCFFADGCVKKIDLSAFEQLDSIQKIIKHQQVFASGKIGTGGYCVTFNDSIDIAAYMLYSCKKALPLVSSDFTAFVQKNILDTAESCNCLDCSRQNLAYMVSKGMLNPIKENVKGNLYIKSDVLKNKW